MSEENIAYRLRTNLPQARDRVSVGELRVSPICVGTVSHPETIAAAFEAGINFFLIAADMHWRNYEASREGIRSLLNRPGFDRKQIVVAGTSYAAYPAFSHVPFHELLAEVPGLGTLDMTIIGGADDASFVPRLHEYEKHRTVFCTKAIGAIFHNDETVKLAEHRSADARCFARLALALCDA